MTTLDEFLRARVAEDREALALTLAAAPAPWALGGRSDRPGRLSVLDSRSYEVGAGLGQAMGHMARWGASRAGLVLDMAGALLELHCRLDERYRAPFWQLKQPPACWGCGLDVHGDRVVDDVERCPVRLALASLWATHPEYRPEWSARQEDPKDHS